MEDRRIDVLIMQNNNSYCGGYVKWFTDVAAVNGGYQAVVFYRDDRMTVVRHGPQRDRKAPDGDPVNRGTGRICTVPNFGAVDYTKLYSAEIVVEDLKPRKDSTIGLLGTNAMAYPFLDHIKNGAPTGASFVDATDMVDEIKAVKSEEEISRIRRTAQMQDAAMDAVLKAIEPGRKISEMTALARYVGEMHGSDTGLFMANCGPAGTPSPIAPRRMQNREIRDGDIFSILIENNGAGGFYTEIGRTCVLGAAPQRTLDEFAFTLEAQKFTLGMIVPGADPAEIFARYNEFMRQNGRPEEERLHAHGQGYDLVERPMIYPEETIKLAGNMNIVVHPTYATDTEFSWICDNYILTEDGVGESIHRTPQKIFEI